MATFDPLARLSQPFGSYCAIFREWAGVQGDAVALRDDNTEISWRQMVDRIDRIAARLVETGLARGQSVAILGNSNIEYGLIFLAAVRAGGVAAPLTTSASEEQLVGMAKDSGARHLFIDRAKADELGAGFMPDMTHIVFDEELDSWMAPEGTPGPSFEPDPSDNFNIIYSSGTTGIPKGIVHTHQMRWRQFGSIAASYLAADMPVRAMASTPLYSNTTMISFLSPLLAGGSARITSRFKTLTWLRQAQADRATQTMLVPVQYRRLMEEPEFDRFDLSSMTIKYCTSAPFPADLKREVVARMPGALNEIYSMTEGGIVCILACHDFPDKLHTVGRPAPGSELRVLDANDQQVAAGEPGNLVGKSGTMMTGYKDRPDKTAEAFWTDPATGEVWMRAGDIGRIDADGFVELVGRAKDMIISGGFNIYPSDLEAELEKEPDVIEAAVVGVTSDKWGETPVGFICVAENGRAGDEIMAAVNARLGKTQRLSRLHLIDEMPRSHIGKLLKTDLRAKAEELHPAATI